MPDTGTSDHTGRLRGLWVTLGAFSAGSPNTGASQVYTRTYTWQADQVAQIDTCLLSATTPQTETYAYDRMMRLTSAVGPLSSTIGGPYT